MSFDEAIELASRDERFMATVYAMNTLLIHKGIYTQKEFESLFAEWMKKKSVGKPARKLVYRPLWPSRSSRNILPGRVLAIRFLTAVIPDLATHTSAVAFWRGLGRPLTLLGRCHRRFSSQSPEGDASNGFEPMEANFVTGSGRDDYFRTYEV